MARTGNGTTAKIVGTAGLPGPLLGYSYHFFYMGVAIPGTAAIQAPFSFSANNASTDLTQVNLGFSWSHTSAAFVKAAFHRTNSTGGNAVAQIPAALSANTWYAIGATWDQSHLRVYLNGSLQATTATATVQNGTNGGISGMLVGNSQTTGFCPGTLAEVAFSFGVWTAADMAALASGVPASRLQPITIASVQESPDYWPLLGDNPEPSYSQNHRRGTVTGTTIANHPGVQSLVAFP